MYNEDSRGTKLNKALKYYFDNITDYKIKAKDIQFNEKILCIENKELEE